MEQLILYCLLAAAAVAALFIIPIAIAFIMEALPLILAFVVALWIYHAVF